MNKRLTTDEFIKKAKKIHGEKYDYSKVNYIDSSIKVCNENGLILVYYFKEKFNKYYKFNNRFSIMLMI